MHQETSWLHDVLSALAYSFGAQHNVGGELSHNYNDLARFMSTQHANLPDYLRHALHLATLGLDLSSLPNCKGLMHKQPAGIRADQIRKWKGTKWSAPQDLMRYYESLAVFALHTRAEET